MTETDTNTFVNDIKSILKIDDYLKKMIEYRPQIQRKVQTCLTRIENELKPLCVSDSEYLELRTRLEVLFIFHIATKDNNLEDVLQDLENLNISIHYLAYDTYFNAELAEIHELMGFVSIFLSWYSESSDTDNQTKVRGFNLVKGETDQTLFPRRETAHAAGYDFKAAKTVTIQPHEIAFVPTGIKAYMQANEVLHLYDRSSNPKKRGIVLANSVGVIDSNYYENEDNDGHIQGIFMNLTDKPVTIKKGDRIMQGVFITFLTTDDDHPNDAVRAGGIGSTGE